LPIHTNASSAQATTAPNPPHIPPTFHTPEGVTQPVEAVASLLAVTTDCCHSRFAPGDLVDVPAVRDQ
jgi:hypothetical protein